MGDAEVTASQWKYVEVGRVALFSAGPHAGRLAAIVQIIDHKRVSPTRLPRMQLGKIKIDIWIVWIGSLD